MQPTNKIDTVHGYLTPKRILSSMLNPSSKGKINRSMTSEEIPKPSPSQEREHLNTSYQGQGLTTTPNKYGESSYKKKPAAGPIEQSLVNVREDDESNFVLHGDGKAKGKNENTDFIRVYNDNIGTSSRVSRNSKDSGAKGVKPTDSLMQNSRAESRKPPVQEPKNTMNIQQSQSRKFIMPSKHNPQIFRLSVQDSINKLSKIKNSLEQQIGQLKKLLDETSLGLENMDNEYEQLKQKILTFTSKALDSAFRQYKKGLPNWSLYEGVQQRGLNKIAQINQMLDICSNQDKYKAAGGKEVVEKKIQQLKGVAQQVKDARTQCMSHRPIIEQEKIKRLEQALRQIAQF